MLADDLHDPPAFDGVELMGIAAVIDDPDDAHIRSLSNNPLAFGALAAYWLRHGREIGPSFVIKNELSGKRTDVKPTSQQK
jgi:hypothetical protein